MTEFSCLGELSLLFMAVGFGNSVTAITWHDLREKGELACHDRSLLVEFLE